VEYSMDELEGMVQPKKFFRINRQFLISIDAVENMTNYFNGRLHLSLKPPIEKKVIISRERVYDFKKWMGR
jgi:two-component system response regulator LytT